MTAAGLNISAVERETRLSKDVLRVWEKRYGFPVPERDAHGERCYSAEQVARLCLIRRLMDQGWRPGRLMRLSDAQLAQLTPRAAGAPMPDAGEADAVAEVLASLERDPAGLRQGMQHQLARLGLERFVLHLLAPLTTAVGMGWADGSLDIVDEHFYTETSTRLLRQAIGTLPGAGPGPRILLTSLPGETHGLGLLMAEALLALDGAHCIALGTETPAASIVRAAQVHGADVVALSFSAAYPRRQLAASLQHLRALLAPATALWAGGAGVAGLAPLEGVHLLPTLESGRHALAAWRAAQRTGPA